MGMACEWTFTNQNKQVTKKPLGWHNLKINGNMKDRGKCELSNNTLANGNANVKLFIKIRICHSSSDL